MEGVWIRKPNSGTTVVFVHGVLSDGEKCWTHESGTYWPDLLADEESVDQIGIYEFTYKTGFFSGTYRLGDVVDAFEESADLDGVLDCDRMVFVCHSMGGIVARKFVVSRAVALIDKSIEIGLFFLASPSLGSNYANWLNPLARLFGHSQADALRFSRNNSWLLDLDTEFLNLKESGKLRLKGKEFVEDNFYVLKGIIREQVVSPVSGARYFGNPIKVPNSDHSSISKVANKNDNRHKRLLRFIREPHTEGHQSPAGIPLRSQIQKTGKPSVEYEVEQTEINKGNSRLYHVSREGRTLTFADVFDLWKSNPIFVSFFISIFERCGYRGYVWETAPITKSSLSAPFEFVIHSSPRASNIADHDTFKEYFDVKNAPEGIVSFNNLGGDALLVVPSPYRDDIDYSGLPQFLENAPYTQKLEIWRQVSAEASSHLSENPLWISVAGGGIAWLHIRLDSEPKYYRHRPYTELSLTDGQSDDDDVEETLHLLCITACRAFVDLVRLNFVFVSPDAPDAIRANEFKEISDASQTDFRREIDAFTSSLTSQQNLLFLGILKQMSFISRNFSTIVQSKSRDESASIYYEGFFFLSDDENWKSFQVLASKIRELMRSNPELLPEGFRDATDVLIQNIKSDLLPEEISVEEFYPIRWRSQDVLQQRLKLPYILLDMADRTNLAYCLLDLALFERLGRRKP